VVVILTTPLRADQQPSPQPASTAAFDPVAATEKYLASVPPEKRAQSDTYFEGGYWLELWTFLLGAAAQWLLLQRGWSAGMRDRAARLVRFRPLQTAAYWTQYLLATSLLLFPFSVYAGFIREHQYGLATQTFPAWLGDQAKGLGVGLVLGGLAVVTLYGVFRRMPRTWWLWGSMVMIGFNIVTLLIGPVFIRPLFNTYTPLADPRVRDPILEMARAHGVQVSEIYQVDASRQTTRISANVSGLLGTERISLNDNLLRRGSVAEIKSVMGHELGHYVLNHMYENVLFTSIVIVVGFGFIRWGFDRSVRRWGARWGVRDIGDVTGLPLIVLLFSIYGYAITPIQNTFIRSNEYEADLFGLNAAREPDGFAEISLKLGEYRKLEPGPIEEWIFFDHPSGRTRILAAMTWKAYD
jgi:STE24 endopeptidase